MKVKTKGNNIQEFKNKYPLNKLHKEMSVQSVILLWTLNCWPWSKKKKCCRKTSY